MRAALAALQVAYGRAPLLTREGGSVPVVNEFRRVLGVDSLLLGLGLPDDRFHAPDEKFDLVAFAAGMRLGAWLWQKLA